MIKNESLATNRRSRTIHRRGNALDAMPPFWDFPEDYNGHRMVEGGRPSASVRGAVDPYG